MSELAYDETFEQLAAGYFDQVLDDAQTQQLKRLLHEDDRRVKRFAELAQLHQMIESEFAYQQQARRFNPASAPTDSGTGNALVELARLYEDEMQAQGPMNFDTWRQEQADKKRAERQRLWRNRFIIVGTVAALIALVAVLTTQFITTNPAPQNLADNTATTDPSAPAVATLTNTHNATWAGSASAAPARGSKLHPNTRLTLTAGFAEITTARGAIAIVEAPATIELLDNNNALRLHAGKLVGICETESSKGFLVRTPHMDVVDLSTAFAVWVRKDEALNATDAYVLEGSVLLKPNPESFTPFEQERLEAGAARRAAAGQGTITAIEHDSNRVFAPLPRLYGRSLPAGGRVLHWGFEQGQWANQRGGCTPRIVSTDRARPDASPQYTEGVVGRAMHFDGSYRIEQEAVLSDVFAGPFTIEAWVWLKPEGPVRQRIISDAVFGADNAASAGVGFGVQREESGAYRPIFTAYGIADTFADTEIPAETWAHLAVSVDRRGRVAFYRDGKPVPAVDGENQLDETPRPSHAACWIGDSRVSTIPNAIHPDQHWHGQIDELAVYRRVLSTNELKRSIPPN